VQPDPAGFQLFKLQNFSSCEVNSFDFCQIFSKQLQLWLQKDAHESSHPDKPLGQRCLYPVHSLKQKKLLSEAGSPRNLKPVNHHLAEMCITGSKLTKATRPEPVVPASTDQSDRDNGNSGVRTILNILDSFKLEDQQQQQPPPVSAIFGICFFTKCVLGILCSS
jgi:hypothetical protein